MQCRTLSLLFLHRIASRWSCGSASRLGPLLSTRCKGTSDNGRMRGSDARAKKRSTPKTVRIAWTPGTMSINRSAASHNAMTAVSRRATARRLRTYSPRSGINFPSSYRSVEATSASRPSCCAMWMRQFHKRGYRSWPTTRTGSVLLALKNSANGLFVRCPPESREGMIGVTSRLHSLTGPDRGF